MSGTYETTTGLKFSVRANWVPLYINRKLLAGRVFPLHRLEEKIFHRMDTRGSENLRSYFYSNFGFHCEPEDRRLTSADFLRKNRMVGHAYLITHGRTVMVLGYSVFHHRFTKTDPGKGVHIDYFTSVDVNYPDCIRPTYLGKYRGDDTFYRVNGIGRATMALACCLAEDIHPGAEPDEIAIDLTARSDESLINDRYIKSYRFEPYRGKRGKHNDLFLTHKNARLLVAQYEKAYRGIDRPEGNGLTYNDPFKY